MQSRLVIKFWWNRLGDNIYQVVRALHVAIYLNKEILSFPEHPMFNTTKIILTNKGTPEQVKGIFDNFKSKKCGNVDQKLLNKARESNHEKVYTLIKDILKLKKTYRSNDNALYLYMRSGDLFGNKCTNIVDKGTDKTLVNKVDDRAQPPLDFYKHVINSRKWENIYIICEDTSNPNVNELLKTYPNIVYKKNTFEKDIEMILTAVNLTHYHGNLITSLSLFSNNLKNIYSFGIIFENVYKNQINNIVYDTGDYFEQMGIWKVSKRQLKLMTAYKIPGTFNQNK